MSTIKPAAAAASHPDLAARAMRMLAATLLLVVALTSLHPASAVEEGEPAPAFSTADGKGKIVNYPADAAGKPSIVLFWATWCPYCKVAMPRLQEVAEEFADQGVRVYAVNTRQRQDRTDPVAHVERLGYDFVVLPNADNVDKLWNVAGVPGIFVVDANGKVVYRRKPTDEQAGDAIAREWADEVRDAVKKSLKK